MSDDLHIIYDSTPNKQNIFYAFERLITPIAIATAFKPYKESWKEFEYILNIIKDWAITYDTVKDLTQIDMKEVSEVYSKLCALDTKYLSTDGLYAEESYEWILQLQVLIEKANKEKGDK